MAFLRKSHRSKPFFIYYIQSKLILEQNSTIKMIGLRISFFAIKLFANYFPWNRKKWLLTEEIWLLSKNYWFLTKVFNIKFNQYQKMLHLNYYTPLYHKVDIFIVRLWRHIVFGSSAQKSDKYWFLTKVFNITFNKRQKWLIWAIALIFILKLIFL